MAWITVSSVDTRFCYVQLQYDDSSSGNSRPARLVMASKAGATVSSLNFFNVTVNGTNYGTATDISPGQVIWPASTTNVPAGTCTFSYVVNWYDWGSVYYSGSGYIPSGATMEARAVFLGASWNSIAVNSTLSTWSGNTNNRFESFVVHGTNVTSSNIANIARATLRTVNTSSLEKNETFTNAAIVAGQSQRVLNDPVLYRAEVFSGWNASSQIKGCMDFQIATYAYNNTLMAPLANDIPSTVYHTPPAPGTLTAPATASTPDVTISFTGVAANNYTPPDATKLTRTVRYHDANIQEWTYIDNNTQRTTSSTTTATIPVIPGSSTIVEAWHTYYGLASEISTATITSTLPPAANVALYGSVNGQSKKIKKLYGSVNGVSKKLKKVYASVNGETKLIFEDRT